MIAAVDPGTRHCGYCFLAARGTRLEAVEIGAVDTKSKTRAGRLREVFETLTELFDRHRPTDVVVERAFVGKNAQSAIVLGEARGLALVCADRIGARVHEYTAPEAKRAVTMNGLAGKDGVRRAIMLLLGLKEPVALDASDAAALAILHASRS
jgi:crossover junction endodeoxyribonuclease RuvC